MTNSGDFDDYHAGTRLQRRRIKCVPSLSSCFAGATAFVAMMLFATIAFKTCNYYMKACPKRTEPCPPKYTGSGSGGDGTTGCTSSGGPCGSKGEGCTFSCSDTKDLLKGAQNNTDNLARSILALSNALLNEKGNCTTTPAPNSVRAAAGNPTQAKLSGTIPTTLPPNVTEGPPDSNITTTTQRPTVKIDFEVNVVGAGHWSEGVITNPPTTTSEPEFGEWVIEVIGIGSAGGFPEEYSEVNISSVPTLKPETPPSEKDETSPSKEDNSPASEEDNSSASKEDETSQSKDDNSPASEEDNSSASKEDETSQSKEDGYGE